MSPSTRLHGRTLLVVGAHGALGSEVARAAAREGAQVVLLGRRVPKLGQVFDQLLADGSPEPAIYPLDLEGASPADYAQLAETLERETGGLHGLFIAAAEFRGLASIENGDPLDLVRAIHVNLTAPLLLIRALLPLLRASAAEGPRSQIVLTLEDPDRVSRAYWGGYGIAKHGLEGALKVLAQELEGGPVCIRGFRPGPMRTNLRAKAYFAEDPGQWPPALELAPRVVELLAGTADVAHGETLAP